MARNKKCDFIVSNCGSDCSVCRRFSDIFSNIFVTSFVSKRNFYELMKYFPLKRSRKNMKRLLRNIQEGSLPFFQNMCIGKEICNIRQKTLSRIYKMNMRNSFPCLTNSNRISTKFTPKYLSERNIFLFLERHRKYTVIIFENVSIHGESF